jgi:hypothetical protein
MLNQANLEATSKLKLDLEKKETEHKELVEIMTPFSKLSLDKQSSAESNLISFNVGGQTFTTFKSTLSKQICKPNSKEAYQQSNLQKYISGKLNADHDKSGAIFIDRNPSYFDHVLDYFRKANTDEAFTLPFNDNYNLGRLLNEAKFFNIKGLIELLAYPSSTILTHKQFKELMQLCNFPLSSECNLLYRASRDGFDAVSFHSVCNSVPNVLFVIKSENTNIFGGFISKALTPGELFNGDHDAFLFSLVNKHSRPAKLMCKKVTNTVYNLNNVGPNFGRRKGGHDLRICSDANIIKNSYSNLGNTFSHPYYEYKSKEAQSFLAGSYNFKIIDMEAFHLTS